MMLYALNLTANVASLTGAGTANDPYIINTIDELKWMRDQVNKANKTYVSAHYKLMDNLDFYGEADWTPIGIGYRCPFNGSFDGNNKVIKNIKIGSVSSPTRIDYAGFFTDVENGAIANLGVEWIGLYTSSSSAYSSSGGIVGYLDGGSISNCYSTLSISSTSPYSLSSGGIVGHVVRGTIKNCHSNSTVSSTSTSFNNAIICSGGIAGKSVISTIVNCYSMSNVYSNSNQNRDASAYSGGIAGYSNGSVANCYSVGVVSSICSYLESLTLLCSGGIIGKNDSGDIANCYAAGSVFSSSLSSAYSYSFSGGIVGYSGNGSVTSSISLNSSITSINNYSKDYAFAFRGGYNKDGSFSSNYADKTVMALKGSSGSNLETVDILGENISDDLILPPLFLLNKWVLSNSTSNVPYQTWTILEGVNNGYPVFGELPTLTVSFQSNGGSPINPIEVNYGEVLIMPSNPALENYDFDGWYIDAECTQPWNFDNDCVYGSITLYAKWTNSTSIEDMDASKISIYATNGNILVTNATSAIMVYSITGEAIRTIVQPKTVQNIAIQPGYYVVKCGNNSAKVVVY